MDLKDYLRILWRRRWIVLITTIVATIVAIVGTSLIKPIYQASVTLRVAASAGGNLNYTASTYSNQLINTTAKIASSRSVREDLMKSLGLSEEPLITAEVIPDTELIKITVEYPGSGLAAKIANTLASNLITQSNELYTGGGTTAREVLAEQVAQSEKDLEKTRQDYESIISLTPAAPDRVNVAFDQLQLKQRNYEALLSQYESMLLQEKVRANMMTVVEEAVAPESPFQPRAAYNYLLGFVIGLLGGIVLAFMAESFDSTLYNVKDIEIAAALPILAKIPKASQKEVCMFTDATSSLSEAFRNLALNVLMSDKQKSKSILLIIGAEPKQGKSTIVHNLAIALAEYGKKVVAVDCDMRLPKLHELFNIPNESGLKDILEEKDSVENLLANPLPSISVLTSGSQPVNPSQLLGSTQMAEVIKNLHQEFDYVLLDTPALLAVSDTTAIIENAELIKSVNALILVVRQSNADRQSVQAATKFLKDLPNKSVKVVINASNDVASNYYDRARLHRMRGFAFSKIIQAGK